MVEIARSIGLAGQDVIKHIAASDDDTEVDPLVSQLDFDQHQIQIKIVPEHLP